MAGTIAAMSALGQERTFFKVCAMSALPPKAYIVDHEWHVRFVQKKQTWPIECLATRYEGATLLPPSLL